MFFFNVYFLSLRLMAVFILCVDSASSGDSVVLSIHTAGTVLCHIWFGQDPMLSICFHPSLPPLSGVSEPPAPHQLTGNNSFSVEHPGWDVSSGVQVCVHVFTLHVEAHEVKRWMSAGDKTSPSLEVDPGTSCPRTNKGQSLRPT